MSQSITETRLTQDLNKTVVNFLLFIAGMIIVTAIMTWGENPGRIVFAGTLIVVVTCFMVLYVFLFQFHREVLHVTRKVFFLLLAMIIFVAAAKIVAGLHGKVLVFLIPFAIIPIIIRTFYDARLALLILLFTAIMCGFLVPQAFRICICDLCLRYRSHFHS